MEIFKKLPSKEELIKQADGNVVFNVNGHIHTPFSFSAFSSVEQAILMAKNENVNVLGINDFFVTDGYDSFYQQTTVNKIFPLFNIEFIGLLKEEQKNGIRVNDPNNPGRTYFSGKGLDYPVTMPEDIKNKVDTLKIESQEQVKEMVEKADAHMKTVNPSFSLSYSEIKSKYARELVRERHIAKAIRELVFSFTSNEEERKQLFKEIYQGKESKVDIENAAALENEIRSNLLKSGGVAFVEEDDNAFLEIDRVIDIIIKAGGIPCYPVLLDDAKGNYTDYEGDFEKLYNELSKRNIGSIELIPGRNTFENLSRFVKFFDDKEFVISFGTEHNSPDLIPIEVSAKDKPLDDYLKKVNHEGACVIAAHQYLNARGEEGFIDESGKPKLNEKDYFIRLGQAVITSIIK